jgi:hypothetical protein
MAERAPKRRRAGQAQNNNRAQQEPQQLYNVEITIDFDDDQPDSTGLVASRPYGTTVQRLTHEDIEALDIEAAIAGPSTSSFANTLPGPSRVPGSAPAGPSSAEQKYTEPAAKPKSPSDGPQKINEFTCPVCYGIPKNATMTPCGHVMCGECLFTAVKANIRRATGQVRGNPAT